MIKVIGGKYRSRNLQTPSSGTEPTKNRVREAMMSALTDLLPGAVVLDLFAGSGALGIEALSRGASKAYFVDHEAEALSVIKENLTTLRETSGIVYGLDYQAFLQRNDLPQFDVVFLDPPYAAKHAYEDAVKTILDRNLLSPYGAIVLEYEGGISVDLSSFAKCKEYTYGKTKVLIARKSL
jgi:16S rRNA (guanine966-N2)-methyltransferase